jgi:ABC-type branched-subunit amino acid transport system substrate-binding protein
MKKEDDHPTGDGGEAFLNKPMDRRSFLKIAGATGAAVGLGSGLGGVLSACGDDTSSDSSTTSSSEPIKFGILGSMGDVSGQNALRVCELMFKKINAAGGILGRPCEVVGPFDDHMETAQAITGYETLISQKVDVILGVSIDDVEAALLARIARQPDTLYLSLFASTQAFMENVLKDYEHFKTYFMYTPTDEGLYYCVQNPAVTLKEQYGWTKVHMLREDMVWTEGIETFFKEEAPKAGLEIAGISVVPVDVEDLTPYFRSAEQAGAQMMMTFISVFGERLANQAWSNKVPMAIFGHNGILNDYGYWDRGNGAWGTMATTSTWGSLEKQAADWRDFVTEWFTTYSDDPRTPIWVGECTWRAINSYKEAVERANTFDLAKVIPELEKTYYPDAPTRGGFYGDGQGDWPHAWCSPIDATAMASADPERGAGLWESSPWSPLAEWVPPDLAPEGTFILPGQSADYGLLITQYPEWLAAGKYIKPPYLQI